MHGSTVMVLQPTHIPVSAVHCKPAPPNLPSCQVVCPNQTLQRTLPDVAALTLTNLSRPSPPLPLPALQLSSHTAHITRNCWHTAAHDVSNTKQTAATQPMSAADNRLLSCCNKQQENTPNLLTNRLSGRAMPPCQACQTAHSFMQSPSESCQTLLYRTQHNNSPHPTPGRMLWQVGVLGPNPQNPANASANSCTVTS